MKNKGFGKVSVPTYWIQIIYLGDRPAKNKPVFCTLENTMRQARDIVANAKEAIDQVFVIEGKGDPDCPGKSDIRADFRTKSFVACGETARRAS